MNDWELVQQWASARSESAFTTLVQRHVDFVHACARRQVNDPETANDVTQGVFLLLARKAGSIKSGVILTSWLFRTTCFLAARALRTERRRRHNETEATAMNQTLRPNETTESAELWAGIEPHLDAAVAALPRADRDAVLMRFFERKPMRDVGIALGINEDAAKKRVSRAVDKLRDFLARRGIAITALALAALLTNPPRVDAAFLESDALVASITTAVLQVESASAPAAAMALANGGARDWFWAAISDWVPVGVAIAVLSLGVALWRTQNGLGDGVDSNRSTNGSPNVLPRIAQPRLSAASQDQNSGVSLTVLDDRTGQPLAGARLMAEYYGQWALERTISLTTDSNGQALVPVGSSRPHLLRVWLSAPKYIPLTMDWHDHEFIEPLQSHTCRLTAGREVRGEVHDDSGRPIAGAEVTVHGFGLDLSIRDNFGYHPSLSAAVTDAEGRFYSNQQPNCLPSHGGGMIWSITHPEYIRSNIEIKDLAQMESNHVIVLRRGIVVRGRVVDEISQPVKAAYIAEEVARVERYQSTNSTADGEFVLGIFPAGNLHLTALAKGFERLNQSVAVTAGMAPVTLTMKVNERFDKTAPGTESLAEFRVEGRVVDAETEEPIPEFKVVRRQPTANWYNLVGYGHQGAFDWDLQLSYADQIALSVQAAGYETAESNTRSVSDGVASFLFRLKRNSALRGRVLQPDGRPAIAANIGLVGRGYGVRFQPPSGMANHGAPANQTHSDVEGAFSLDAMPKMEFVLFVHESGCALLPIWAVTNTLVPLAAWGTIEGTWLSGGQPLRGQTIDLGAGFVPGTDHQIPFDMNEKTDEHGYFAFRHVPPGKHVLHRLINYHEGSEGEIGLSHPELVEVHPGETVQVHCGGHGRRIVGKLALDTELKGFRWQDALPKLEDTVQPLPQPPTPIGVNGPDEAWFRWNNRWNNSIPRYYLEMQSDGTFQVDDVTPGSYLLSLRLTMPATKPADNHFGPSFGEFIGNFNLPVTVNTGEGLIDLGVVPVAPTRPR